MRHGISVVVWLSVVSWSGIAPARRARPPVPAVDRTVVEAAPVPEPLSCPVQDEQAPGTDLHIRCATQPTLRATRVTFHYRPSGALQYDALLMKRSGNRVWTCLIPAAQVTGKFLQYYIEAHDRNRRLAAFSGKARSPNVISIRSPTVRAAGSSSTAGSGTKPSPADILEYLLDHKSDPAAPAAKPAAKDTTLDALLERETRAPRPRSRAAPTAQDAQLDALFDRKGRAR
jgi:hypothetical protein